MFHNQPFEHTAWPCFRITIFWIIGILLALDIPIALSIVWLFLFSVGILYGMCICSKRKPMHGLWTGSLAWLLTVGVSYATVRLHVLQQQQESWSKWIAQSKLEGYCATVERVFPDTGNWMRCNACVNRIKIGPNWYASKGVVMLFLPKKSHTLPNQAIGC